jgi:hypothetical protein
MSQQEKEFNEWYKTLKTKPGQMPYDDWFVCMREAYLAGRTDELNKWFKSPNVNPS